MPQPSIAAIITACASAFTAIAFVITALAGLTRSRRVEGKVDQVHTIVNQQRTDAQNYQRALINALRRAGVDVPEDQSVDSGQAE